MKLDKLGRNAVKGTHRLDRLSALGPQELKGVTGGESAQVYVMEPTGCKIRTVFGYAYHSSYPVAG